MKNRIKTGAIFILVLTVLLPSVAFAAVKTTRLKIEGLISPASPKALLKAVTANKKVKVIRLNLKDTESGWPELIVNFDPALIPLAAVESLIAQTADPAGHNYKVHHGPLLANAELTEEELEATSKLGTPPLTTSKKTNPIPKTKKSVARGKKLYLTNCAKCHGLRGNGYGTAAHAIMTWPRQLFAWNKTDSATDGYLFQFITYGSTDMPPWGLILNEDERWNLINYIKSMPKPVFK